MDHESAIRIQAAERYTLQELDPASCEEFEEHFFACPECAEQVRAGAILAANAKKILQSHILVKRFCFSIH
jgi:hypothetical protein